MNKIEASKLSDTAVGTATLAAAADPTKTEQQITRAFYILGAPHSAFTSVCTAMHYIALTRGWWQDPATGEFISRNKGEMIALMHSELSELLEAERVPTAPSAKIPDFTAAEEECADLFIRLADYCVAQGYDLAGALLAKAKYNLTRKDHSLEARAAGGKAF